MVNGIGYKNELQNTDILKIVECFEEIIGICVQVMKVSTFVKTFGFKI